MTNFKRKKNELFLFGNVELKVIKGKSCDKCYFLDYCYKSGDTDFINLHTGYCQDRKFIFNKEIRPEDRSFFIAEE